MTTKTSQYIAPASEPELVLAWLRRAREAQMQHYEMAQRLSTKDKWYGVPVIILTSIMGVGSLISVISDAIPTYAKILGGISGAVAAVLSSLQTFFKFSERAENHRNAAIKFGAIRRELEAVYVRTDNLSPEYMASLRARLDELAHNSPDVPVAVFKYIQKNDMSSQIALPDKPSI